MILAATGHRPEKLGGYTPNPMQTRLRGRLLTELVRLAPEEGISGMALGWDQWFAEACTDLGIPWTAAVPFEGQEAIWPRAAQDSYRLLLRAAKRIVVVSPGEYEDWKMDVRNHWMVDQSTHLLACWNGTQGGTAKTFRYAESKGRSITNGTIIRIDPEEYRRSAGACGCGSTKYAPDHRPYDHAGWSPE